MMNNAYTLITGASAGIGKAMAMESAHRGANVLLIALDEPILYEAARQIEENYGVEVDCLGIDLAREDAPERTLAWCRDRGYQVNTLINNAGFGHSGLLENLPLSEYYKMLHLNNRAMVGMTHQFLPMLKQQPKAYLLNMSSMEATLPRPYKAVYAGTKTFVYGFTLALREELKSFGINVSVLCPGPALTQNAGNQMRLQAHGKKAKLLVLTPEEVAEAAIDGLMRNRQVIVPGIAPRLIVNIMYWFPTTRKMSILERLFRGDRDHRLPSNTPSQPASK